MPPVYEYLCQNDHEFERYLPMFEYQTLQFCDCGAPARKLISKPNVFVSPDICYDSPIDGRPITSKKQRLEDMARSGCVEYDPGIKQDRERFLEKSQKQLESKIDQTIENEIEKMPAAKRERLANELQSGITVEPVRQ